MEQREEVEAENLVVGTIYADIEHLDTTPVLLEYVGNVENRLNFKLVGGRDFYMQDEKGLIRFGINDSFYLPTESELELVKQTK